MRLFFRKPTRLVFAILISCAVPVISWGHDGTQLQAPLAPSKRHPVLDDCPQYGAVAAYEPTWHQGRNLDVRVQLPNPGDASKTWTATLYYSYPDTPACTKVSATNLKITGTNLSETTATNVNRNTNNNWLTFTFVPGMWGGSADGTGKGIIIITKSDDMTQNLVKNDMTLEYVK